MVVGQTGSPAAKTLDLREKRETHVHAVPR